MTGVSIDNMQESDDMMSMVCDHMHLSDSVLDEVTSKRCDMQDK